MANYQAKDSNVSQRQLKVQRLVIPFTLTHNATPASVVTHNDEPSFCFFATEGVDNITGALASGETATYTNSPDDSDGKMNIFIRLGSDSADKVCQAHFTSRTTGVSQPCFLGDADGISSAGNIMLSIDSSVDFSATDVDGCIDVEYTVSE